MKKKLKALMMLLVMVQMVFGSAVGAYAAPGDDNPNDNTNYGTPKISVINGPVFDVDAGSVNEVKVNIKNLSSAGARSIVIVPKINEIEGNPLSISLQNGDSNLSVLQPNTTKTLTFSVDVDKAATAKTYSVDVKFSFFNEGSQNFETTSTIYFKVKNISGGTSVSLESIAVAPDSLEIGGTGKLNVVVKNKGSLNLYNLEVALSDIDPAGVSVSGMSSKKYGTLQGGLKETVSFDIMANAAMTAGNYPITITANAKDENGRAHTITQKYYVAVGGSSSGKKSDVEIRNLKEPGGSYGVNKNFTVSFDVFNKGTASAKDVKITAKESGDGANIVPKSNSVVSIKEIAPNAGAPVSFTFAATSAAVSKNYTMQFTVEYLQNGKVTTVNQYAGVDVYNPDSDGKTSKPKIIVSQYTSNPLIVKAGSEFDLTMSFLNTHPEKTVKNVKMYLTLSEETSADSKSTGNIFTPVDSSNTFYFDSISPKGTVEKKLRLYVVPEAQPKTYTLTVNFEYEDVKGNEYTAKELLGINVQQATKLETSEIFMPTSNEVSMPISVMFDIYNTGKVDISNLKVAIDGDLETGKKTTFIGNCTKGESSYFEGSFSIGKEGANNVKLIISYDNPSGERIEDIREYVIEGTPPMPVEEMPGGDMPANGGAMGAMGSISKGKIAAIVCAIVVLLIIVLVAVKKIKAKKEAKFIEADQAFEDSLTDAADDVTEVTEGGNGKNEQL